VHLNASFQVPYLLFFSPRFAVIYFPQSPFSTISSTPSRPLLHFSRPPKAGRRRLILFVIYLVFLSSSLRLVPFFLYFSIFPSPRPCSGRLEPPDFLFQHFKTVLFLYFPPFLSHRSPWLPLGNGCGLTYWAIV